FTFLPRDRGTLSRALKSATLALTALSGPERAVGVLAFGLPAAVGEVSLGDRTLLAHLNALRDQVNLTLETHRLQSELRAALESLRAAQGRLVEMEKLRTAGTLAASVAHDIRNNLTSFQVELALQPEEVRESLCAHLNRFSTLTPRLLAFSRPDMLENRPVS